MSEIFPEHTQEENQDQCETDHQKRGGNELYLKILSGKELDDKKEKNAKEGQNDSIDHGVEES